MNTRREFLWMTFGAGLLAATGALALPAKDKSLTGSPIDAVRQFLTLRKANEPRKAYALLSAETQAHLPCDRFAQEADMPRTPDTGGMTPKMFALTALFTDTQNATGYQFEVRGAAPDNPHNVLVSARPPGPPLKDVLTLEVVTTSGNGRAVLDLMRSYQTDPVGFEAMREKARAVTSSSNLKQIGLAVFQYAQDHGGRMPDADQWVDQIAPYWADKAPLAERIRQFRPLMRDPSAPEGQDWNYAFNTNLSGVKLADIKDPSRTVLVFESTAGVKNAADAGTSVPHPGRHSGGDYYAFADGHVQWYKSGSALNFTP